jgi:hypothetical protein
MMVGTHDKEAVCLRVGRKQREGIQEGSKTRYSPQGHPKGPTVSSKAPTPIFSLPIIPSCFESIKGLVYSLSQIP